MGLIKSFIEGCSRTANSACGYLEPQELCEKREEIHKVIVLIEKIAIVALVTLAALTLIAPFSPAVLITNGLSALLLYDLMTAAREGGKITNQPLTFWTIAAKIEGLKSIEQIAELLNAVLKDTIVLGPLVQLCYRAVCHMAKH